MNGGCHHEYLIETSTTIAKFNFVTQQKKATTTPNGCIVFKFGIQIVIMSELEKEVFSNEKSGIKENFSLG